MDILDAQRRDAVGAGGRRTAFGLGALTLTAVGLSLVRSLGAGSGQPPSRDLDVWLAVAGYTLAALTTLAAVWSQPGRHTGWWLVVTAVGLHAGAQAIIAAAVTRDVQLSFPSVADAALVLSNLVLACALVVRRLDRKRETWTIWLLDGLAVTSLVGGLLAGLLDDVRPGGSADVPTGPPGTASGGAPGGAPGGPSPFDLVQSTLDVTLLATLVAFGVVGRRQWSRATGVLAAGVAVYGLSDLAIHVGAQVADLRPGGPLDSLRLLGTAAIALAVLLEPPRVAALRPAFDHAGSSDPSGRDVRTFVMITVVALSALMVAGSLQASPFALALFASAAVIAIGRGVLSFVWQQLAALEEVRAANARMRRFEALVEASTDLIGLMDLSGRLLYLNPSGQRMLDLAAGDRPDSVPAPGSGDPRDLRASLLAQPAGGPLDSPSLDERWQQLLTHGRLEGEHELPAAEGSGSGDPVPVMVSAFTLNDPRSRTAYAVGTIQRDISERRRAEEAVRGLAEQRNRLLSRLVNAQEEERSRIADGVHDEPLQSLGAINLHLEVLRRRVAALSPDLASETAATIDAIQDILGTAFDQLRDLLFDLERPLEQGLRRSLERASQFVFGGTGVAWEVHGDLRTRVDDAQVATAYRICKEALFNVRKHARAQRVRIEIHQESAAFVVVITDDGTGIPSGADRDQPGHRGLAGMRDRALVAGGEVKVSSRPGEGTEVRLSLPTDPR